MEAYALSDPIWSLRISAEIQEGLQYWRHLMYALWSRFLTLLMNHLARLVVLLHETKNSNTPLKSDTTSYYTKASSRATGRGHSYDVYVNRDVLRHAAKGSVDHHPNPAAFIVVQKTRSPAYYPD